MPDYITHFVTAREPYNGPRCRKHEHVQMKWGDVQLKIDAEGTEYLEFNERTTKTRQGSQRGCRPFASKMFATGKYMKINVIII